MAQDVEKLLYGHITPNLGWEGLGAGGEGDDRG